LDLGQPGPWDQVQQHVKRLKSHFFAKVKKIIRTCLKNKVRVQGKAWIGEKAEYTRSCEHFEPFHNAAIDTKIVFEIGSKLLLRSNIK